MCSRKENGNWKDEFITSHSDGIAGKGVGMFFFCDWSDTLGYRTVFDPLFAISIHRMPQWLALSFRTRMTLRSVLSLDYCILFRWALVLTTFFSFCMSFGCLHAFAFSSFLICIIFADERELDTDVLFICFVLPLQIVCCRSNHMCHIILLRGFSYCFVTCVKWSHCHTAGWRLFL